MTKPIVLVSRTIHPIGNARAASRVHLCSGTAVFQRSVWMAYPGHLAPLLHAISVMPPRQWHRISCGEHCARRSSPRIRFRRRQESSTGNTSRLANGLYSLGTLRWAQDSGCIDRSAPSFRPSDGGGDLAPSEQPAPCITHGWKTTTSLLGSSLDACSQQRSQSAALMHILVPRGIWIIHFLGH